MSKYAADLLALNIAVTLSSFDFSHPQFPGLPISLNSDAFLGIGLQNQPSIWGQNTVALFRMLQALSPNVPLSIIQDIDNPNAALASAIAAVPT